MLVLRLVQVVWLSLIFRVHPGKTSENETVAVPLKATEDIVADTAGTGYSILTGNAIKSKEPKLSSFQELYMKREPVVHPEMQTLQTGKPEPPKCPERCKCSAHFKRISCLKVKLQTIPTNIPKEVTELYLGYNLLTRLDPPGALHGLNNLTVLGLNNNNLLDLDPSAFTGLHKLKRLFLTKNHLNDIPNGTFKDLDGLQRLYLQQNKFTELPELSGAIGLIQLVLDSNCIEMATVKESYGTLTKLSSLVLSNNPIRKLKKHDFTALSGSNSLHSLTLARCPLKSIENGTFQPLGALQALNLGYNKIPGPQLKNIINGLAGAKQLSSLDLSQVISTGDLPPSTFDVLGGLPNFRTLGLSHNTIDVLQNGTFSALTSLYYLALSHCKIKTTDTGAFHGLRELKQLDLSDNYLTLLASFPVTTLNLILDHNKIDKLPAFAFANMSNLKNLSLQDVNLLTIDKNAFVGLYHLVHLDLSNNVIPGSGIGVDVFKPLASLKYLKLNGNKMTQIVNETKLFADLQSLEYLDFRENGCKMIPRTVFQPLKNLKILSLQGNQLGPIIDRDHGGQLFGNSINLEFIYLQGNRITTLSNLLFHKSSKLKKISLEDNRIYNWGEHTFAGMQYLQLLNLSTNQISLINVTSVQDISLNATLDLSQNPFSCNCDLRWFRHWINETDIELANLQAYKCKTPRMMMGVLLLDFVPEDITFRCLWLYVVIGATSFAALILIISGVMCYKGRWHLRYLAYKMKHRPVKRALRGFQRLRERRYHFDAFVSCAEDDETMDFVEQHLLPNIDNGAYFLEQHMQCDPGEFRGEHRLFCPKTHLDIGKPWTSAMHEIEPSKKVIFLVNKAYFMDKKKSSFEMPACLLKNINSIIVVLLQDEAMRLMQPALRKKLTDELTWKPENGIAQNLFWEKLKEELNKDVVDEDVEA